MTNQRASSRMLALGMLCAFPFLAVSAPSASAVEQSVVWSCNAGQDVTGRSNTGWGQTKSPYCQTKYLRLTYRTYSGSPTYVTGWYFSETAAYQTAPIVLVAEHRVRSCQYPYTCGIYKTLP